MMQVERMVTLSTIDEKWIDHLDQMASLKDGIWLRGDKQTVLTEYRREAFNMFEDLIASIETTICRRIFRVQPVKQGQPVAVTPTQKLLAEASYQKEDIHESITKEVADAQVPEAKAVPSSQQGSVSDLAAALSDAGSVKRPGAKNQKVKIGRNDPCPCGSGLKYKDCGLIGAPQHQE